MFDLCVTRWAKNFTVHFTLLFRLSLKVLKPLNIKYIWRDINSGKNEAEFGTRSESPLGNFI